MRPVRSNELQIAVDASAFDLPGAGEAGALCLHGLTGTPYEVRPLGEALSRAGIRARGPALPGHNETPAQLAAVRWQEWLENARAHLRDLRDQHSAVFVVGLSMGALLALALAAEESVSAAVVVGTPLRLRQPIPLLVPLVKRVMPFVAKAGGSDIRDPAARARHPGYGVMPLAAVHQLVQLQRHVREALPAVTAPLLVAHGAHDRTADPADSREILARVGSREREHLVLEASAHVVPVDLDGEMLARTAVHFLVRQVRRGG
jgi:carboxylesterase